MAERKPQMYILSTDTAAKTASVCVSKYNDGILKPLVYSTVNGTLTHSESLLPMIDFCLKNANITFNDIEMAAISTGPGSFTGVRIGVATIKGLTFTKPDTSCVGVSALEALAYNLDSYPPGSILLPVMDARRNQFYNAAFSFTKSGKLKRYYEDDLSDFDNIISVISEKFAGKKIILTGDGAELFYSLYQKKCDGTLNINLCGYAQMYEDAFSVAKCAVNVFEHTSDKTVFTSEKLVPVYLRASQAERERNEKLQNESK